jgi:hypothetical protein
MASSPNRSTSDWSSKRLLSFERRTFSYAWCCSSSPSLVWAVRSPSEQTAGILFLIVAGVCYAAAEVAVSKFRLHHHGIEEALAVYSAGFLTVGILLAFLNGARYSPTSDRLESVVIIAGAVFSLWIWHRFGLWYAFLAAMVFAIFLPGYWTSSHSVQHVILDLLYALGLICVTVVRSRHRFDYLDDSYSLVEALLWLGIYLVTNLQLSSLDVRMHWWGFGGAAASEAGRSFYWATCVMIWCLPPIVLARGIRQKDRFVIAVGAIVATLTFVTNKPYLGWRRHTWDPMLLGIALTGVALFIQRWLARGPNGVRFGFTAARLLGKDKRWVNSGSAVLGLVAPHSIVPQTKSQDFSFGGGTSGGGGAGGKF